VTAPNFKPSRRIRDREAIERFRLAHLNEPCEVCELRPGIQVHHRKFRSQLGGDEESNLSWLCGPCHGNAHGVRSFW
jgi:hypothetical protein